MKPIRVFLGVLGSLVLAACSSEAPPTAPQGWEFAPGAGDLRIGSPLEEMRAAGCTPTDMMRAVGSIGIVVPTRGLYAFNCRGASRNTIGAAVRSYMAKVRAAGWNPSMTAGNGGGDGTGGYYEFRASGINCYTDENPIYTNVRYQDPATGDLVIFTYISGVSSVTNCFTAYRSVWVTNGDSGPAAGMPYAPAVPDPEVDYVASDDDLLSQRDARPNCSVPMSFAEDSFCHARGKDSLTTFQRNRVTAAIATIAARGGPCVALANEATAEFNRGDLRFGSPLTNNKTAASGVSNGSAPDSTSWTVIGIAFVTLYTDKSRKATLVNPNTEQVLGPADLVSVIAHEMDHRVNGAGHVDGNPGVTPLTLSCSDLHS